MAYHSIGISSFQKSADAYWQGLKEKTLHHQKIEDDFLELLKKAIMMSALIVKKGNIECEA